MVSLLERLVLGPPRFGIQRRPLTVSLLPKRGLLATHIRTQRDHLNSKVTDIEPPGKI